MAGIPNKKLYKYVKPESLLAWQRVRVANSIAATGFEWAEAVAKYNSGTYNNQYMVVNYNLFKPGQVGVCLRKFTTIMKRFHA